MSLDAFIADAKLRAKSPKAPKRGQRVRPDGGEAYRRTKEELLQMKLEACVPVSVHLRTTYQTCKCGSTFESVNSWPLVKRVSPSLTHFEAVKDQDPRTLSQYNTLPRFIENRSVEVPWCPDCFANATYFELVDEPVAPDHPQEEELSDYE